MRIKRELNELVHVHLLEMGPPKLLPSSDSVPKLPSLNI